MNNCTLIKLFRDTCERFSDKQCIISVCKHTELIVSYSRMRNFVVNVRTVLEKCGIPRRKNQFIGVIGNGPSVEIIALLLGIMDIENAFVFLDASSSHLPEIISKLKIKWVIGEKHLVDNVNSIASFEFMETFEISKVNYSIYKSTCSDEYSSSTYQFAFAVMSSGSTGEPKIIKVSHDSIVPNVLDLKNIYKMVPEDVLYLTTPLTFDPCMVDLFLAFYTGASILIPSREHRFDSNSLSNVFSRITVWYTTPSLFVKWFPKEMSRNNLRILILGGEPFPTLNYMSWRCMQNVKIFNIYGITEISCWASIHLVEDLNKSVPLGKTLSDTIFTIRFENVEDDVGELLIGSHRRRCVVNDDFDLFNEEIWFRPTGDLVKIVNGEYYYVGRKDRRIKLYGHIVDLAQIEVDIKKTNDVEHCCCIFIQNENKIVAFVESNNENFDPLQLEALLRTKLPPIMIPSRIYPAKIPINSHGKICEKSCRELYCSMKTRFQNLSNEFPNLWKQFTGNDQAIDYNLGFIDSGGNSVLALQFTTMLTDLCSVPEDFIASLLSNTNYLDCFKLIENRLYKQNKSNSDAVSQIGMKRVEAQEKPSSSKKFKTSENSKLVSVKGKHFIDRRFMPEDQIESPVNLAINWKHDLGKCVDASPTLIVFEEALAVVCGSHSGQLAMISIPSGDVCLKIRLPDRIESSASISECGKFIFIGCYDKKLYCIDINENNIRWSYETDDIIKSTPVLYKNRLYFGSYDHNFYCLSSERGSLLWKRDLDKSSIYATPIVTDEYIIVATLGGTVAALNLDGTIKHSSSFGNPFFSNPMKLPTKEEFIVIDVAGIIRLIKTDTGHKKCEHRINGNVFSSIAIVDYSSNCKIVFGCYDKNIYCFEILDESLHLLWKTNLPANIYSSPFPFGNCQPEGVLRKYRYIAVTCVNGSVHVIEGDCGNCLTSFDTFGQIFSSPVVHDSYLVVGCRDNFLYCFELA